MKIIHYYTGKQVSDDERSRARAVRLEGGHYLFRDSKMWDGIAENCDKVVSDDDAILEAYKGRGVDPFDDKPFKKAKPKANKPKAKPEAPKAEPEKVEAESPNVEPKGEAPKLAEEGGDPQ